MRPDSFVGMVQSQGVAGGLFVAAVQRMAGYGRRAVLRPGQLASQALRLDLQVEDHRLAVGLVQTVDFQQGFERLVGVRQHLSRVIALEFAGVHPGKGHPGGALRLLVAQCAE